MLADLHKHEAKEVWTSKILQVLYTKADTEPLRQEGVESEDEKTSGVFLACFDLLFGLEHLDR